MQNARAGQQLWSIGRRVAWDSYSLSVCAIVAVAVVARAHGLFFSSIDSDEGTYLVMAQNWLAGSLPYVVVWDQHPPGLPALLAVVQELIPDPVIGARLAATAATLLEALLMHDFCRRRLDQATAGLVSALLYVLCMSRWLGLPANTETFNNVCVTGAFYLLYDAAHRPAGSLWRGLAAAALFGIGLQIKYVIAPEAMLLCLTYLVALHKQHRGLPLVAVTAALLVLVGCAPTLLAILYFWMHGALQPYLSANISSNAAYVGIILPWMQTVRSSASGVLPVSGCFLIVGYTSIKWIHRCQRWFTASSPLTWLIVWTVATVLDICLPFKFFSHYYFALYPPVCIGGALAVTTMVHQRRRQHLALGILILFAAPISLWVRGCVRATVVAQADAPRLVASFLRDDGTPNMTVFVYNYEPVIYALSHVRPPTPYVAGYEMSLFSKSSKVDGVAELQRTMAKQPDFIVVCEALWDEPVDARLDNVVARQLDHYLLVHEVLDRADRCLARIYKK